MTYLRVWLIAIVFAPLTVTAQPDVGRFEITPFGAYGMGGIFTDKNPDIEAELQDSASFGFLFNIRESANTQWEILYSQQNTTAQVAGLANGAAVLDMRLHHLQVGGTYLGQGKTLRPYLAAAIGGAYYKIDETGYDSDTFFAFSIGPGLQFRPTERLGLRLEARVYGTLLKADSRLFCVSDPGGGTAGCAVTVSGDVLWQLHAMAGVVFRF